MYPESELEPELELELEVKAEQKLEPDQRLDDEDDGKEVDWEQVPPTHQPLYESDSDPQSAPAYPLHSRAAPAAAEGKMKVSARSTRRGWCFPCFLP